MNSQKQFHSREGDYMAELSLVSTPFRQLFILQHHLTSFLVKTPISLSTFNAPYSYL